MYNRKPAIASWQLHQEYQQQLSLEKFAQQTIATQAVIKETGFGSHFRSYVLKAVRREMAIASDILDWGAPVQFVDFGAYIFT
ncbi:MAG: hypothetical protein V7L13_18520 [Nostoc sp.]|uniref:hypothetical protein n=1 Tax=Nostoc sp. TaxID=1180 RepID=UPI002FFB0D77